ncbi:MAG: PH domain-containing protein [Bacteroidetes bacterium]|nr:PH domain-containing protein [Bacteroidota bacterium]MCY4204411.1 PH domain-containing protein [Bacteroidota bacterium]
MEEPSAEFRRLHPLTFVHYVFLAIVGFVISFFSSTDTGVISTPFLIFAIVYIIIVGPFSIAKYIRFRYYATNDEIVIYYGVFKRVRRNIPSDRIQNVSIQRNLLSRILGTASVKIETAGTASAEGVLAFVGIQEAERLRNLFRTVQTTATIEENGSTLPGFHMPLQRVALAGIYQFSFALIAVVYTLFFQLISLDVIDLDKLGIWLTERFFSGEIVTGSWPIIAATFILPVLIGGWILGFLQYLIRFYNFRMELGPIKIYRKFGLLTIRESTLPYKRVQSFLIRSNPVMRLRRWYRLEIQTLGLESGERGFQPAMPFAKWSEITSLAPQIRPFTLPDTYSNVSRRTIQRYSIRYSLMIAIPLVILFVLWSENALWGFCLLPLAWGISWMQYLCHQWTFHDGNLLIRRRIFSQQFWIVPVERFQAFEITASFFQRRMGLCTLIVDTAGAGNFRYPRIIDLKMDDAKHLFGSLYDAFQKKDRNGAQSSA